MSNKNLNAVKRIGAKLAYIRKSKKISQIRLAEMTDMNFNYIGQIERGEKNASIESIDKIASALGISLSKLFEFLGSETPKEDDYAYQAYELITAQSPEEQKKLYEILYSIKKYKNI